MTVKTIFHPVTGQSFRMGRRRPSAQALARPRLRLATYLAETLPPAPAGPLGRVGAVTDVVKQVYGNDSEGDCTKAGQAHLIGTFTGIANPPAVIFDAATVVADYLRLTGGQDDGLDEITVLEDWRSGGGIGAAHPISAFASVDATNQAHVQFAVWAFLNGYLGLELPDAWIDPMPARSGFLWDVAGDPDPENGHCVVAIDFTPAGLIVLTWGMWGVMTWGAVSKYLSVAGQGEFHVVLTDEIIEKANGRAPGGFDATQLRADVAALA